MPVPLIDILNILSSAINYPGLTASKVNMFILYVYDMACEGFPQISILMMCVTCSSSKSTLMRVIRGGYMWACTPALNHVPFFMVDVLVLLRRIYLHHT